MASDLGMGGDAADKLNWRTGSHSGGSVAGPAMRFAAGALAGVLVGLVCVMLIAAA